MLKINKKISNMFFATSPFIIFGDHAISNLFILFLTFAVLFSLISKTGIIETILRIRIRNKILIQRLYFS